MRKQEARSDGMQKREGMVVRTASRIHDQGIGPLGRIIKSLPMARESERRDCEVLFSSTVLFADMNSLNAGRPSDHPLAGIAHNSVTVRYFSWERLIIMTRPYLRGLVQRPLISVKNGYHYYILS